MKRMFVLILCSDSYFSLSVSFIFLIMFLIECIWNCYMHVTHSSGGNRQVDVNINNGGGYLEISELEVKLRVINVNKSSNLIVVVLSYFIIIIFIRFIKRYIKNNA